MNQYITGSTIRSLREKHGMTQAQLAYKLGVSDKAVSKWETGKGYPDISLLEPLAEVFSISITELLSGEQITNSNVSANMLRTKFYVCPICGNILHSTGESVISCCGINLSPLEAEDLDAKHGVSIAKVEDDYFISIDHDMTKTHYISFVAAISSDRVQLVKLYPEGSAEVRFPIRGIRKIVFYCNRDGMFSLQIQSSRTPKKD